MRKPNIFSSRVLWILILNGILIIIPISGFYFIQVGNSQAVHQRTMDLLNLNQVIADALKLEPPDSIIFEAPVLGPYMRILIVENKQIKDSGWLSNPAYIKTNYYFTFLSEILSIKIDPPDLKKTEILSRLSIYTESKSRKLGIINYRFMYSVIPYNTDSGKTGTSVVLIDKADIQQNTKLNKIILLLIFLISCVIAIVISVIYYFLFIKPLFILTNEALEIKKLEKMELKIFALKNRKDEIGQLSKAFYQSTSELFRKKELVESFTSDVLHELKNPLTAIRTCVELLEKKLNSRNDQSTSDLLEIIARESGRIEKLLYDIKELSLYEIQKDNHEECHPVNVIKEIASLYAEQGVRLLLDVNQKHTIAIPAEKLACILKNLLDNAIDFSPQYGSITIAYNHTNKVSTLTVSDQGSGIPNSEKAKVFKRFYSNRSNTQQKGLHSGLGLSIVKKILDGYQHPISLSDNKPTGCCFEITF